MASKEQSKRKTRDFRFLKKKVVGDCGGMLEGNKTLHSFVIHQAQLRA